MMKRVKRLTAALLAACLVVSLLPVGAGAVEGRTIPVADGGDLAAAVEQASNGDTIELSGTGHVNALTIPGTDSATDEPWFINKRVTIVGKTSDATISIRRGGVVLGANVTFKDLKIDLSSNVRNSIMANGYTLTLENVSSSNLSFNLFCGGFINSNSETFSGTIPTPGPAGIINIKGNTTLQHTDTYGKGNIYAGNLCMGGMNADNNNSNANGPENVFAGTATIVIDGSVTRSDIGTIYGCGGQQRIPVDAASGKITLPDMNNYTVSGKVSVTFRGPTELREFTIWGLSELKVEAGNLTLLADSTFRDNATISVASGTILDISALGNLTLDSFAGGGSMALGQAQTLNIINAVSGITKIGIGGIFNQASTAVPVEEHTYIRAAKSDSTSFELLPYQTWPDMKLLRGDNGDWTVINLAENSVVVSSLEFEEQNVIWADGFLNWQSLALLAKCEGDTEGEDAQSIDLIPLTINVNGTQATRTKVNWNYVYNVNDLLLEVSQNSLFIYSPTDEPDATNEQVPNGRYTIEVIVPGTHTATGRAITAFTTLTVGNVAPSIAETPTKNTGLKWNGTEQTGVNSGDGYFLTGHKEIDVGEYTATATLAPGYQWEGGSTDEKTIEWRIDKADGPDAPTGLKGIAPTTVNGTDGKITGTKTNPLMEYASNESFANAQDCTGEEITGLASGTYYVRVKETETHNAGAYAIVEVPAANVKEIQIPTANTGLKWTGAELVGVNEGEGYTLTGHKATAVGSHTATAKLEAGYQWEKGDKEAKTIVWKIDKADGPSAPSNLLGIPPTAAGANDGKITGTKAEMEYAANAEFNGAQNCTGTEITGLAPGTYYVRVKETATHEAGAYATVKVPEAGQPIAVPIPTANTGLKWTGEEQVGVPEGTGYTLTGNKATDAGSYTATAALASNYQWSDGSATPKTIPWTIAKGEAPAAPTGLRGTAPTSASGANGKITGTETTMQYAAKADFTNAKDCAAGETTGLASGSYYVRFKETNNHPAGLAAEVTVPKYDGGGDSGGGGSTGGGSTGGGDIQEPVTTPQQTANAINAANSGSTVTMTLPSGNTVSRTVWQALAGKDVTLEIETGRFTWSVDGRDVDSKALPTSLNLGAKEGMDLIPASVLEQTPRGTETLQISLNHNGAFAVPLTLSVDLGRDNAQRWANLYYYNTQEKKLEFQSASLIGDNGRAAFPMDHASSYAVVVDRVSHGSEGGDDPFLDVSLGAWYYDVVRYVYQKGLMTGTGRDTFSPLSLVTRAQAVTTLHRMAGSPAARGAGSFRDVAAGSYYADAVAWAVEKGVATGHSADRFAPDAPITREQLAALLCRYARVVEGENVNVSAQVLLRFPDQGRVSAYAVQPMGWAVEKGLIDGFQDGSLQPQGQANRAQLAAILSRFAER